MTNGILTATIKHDMPYVGERWKRSVGLIMREMKIYYLESRSRGISYMKYVTGMRTRLVIGHFIELDCSHFR
jgi:hypothetical protein